MAYNPAKAAAAIHRHMCVCKKHGYTQGEGRWGGGHGSCKVKSQGRTFVVPAGDYDCSSSVITAWKLALSKTCRKGCLDGATYTGNMRAVFTGSGLFKWKPMSYIAQTGDVYLNEANHTAMCQTAVPDVMSEFLINENGGIVGGRRGDQTGTESIVHGFRTYSFGWDGILEYVGGTFAKPNAYKDAKGNTHYRKAVIYTNPKRCKVYRMKRGKKVFVRWAKAGSRWHVDMVGSKKKWARTKHGNYAHLADLRKK